MENEIIQRIAGKAIILHEGKVLIIRESAKYDDGTHAGNYDFPGGRVEPGESLYASLAREVKEECGLDVNIGKPIFVGEWSPIVKNRHLQIFGIFFECTTKNVDIVLSKDYDEYKWIVPTD